jgi:hypothetical protein
MEDFQRFSILTFPQAFEGASLTVNIVVLPRNQNPLVSAIDDEPTLAGAPAFADAKLSFVARVVSGLAGLPGAVPALAPRAAPVVQPASARAIFEALGQQFVVANLGALNSEANLKAKAAPAATSVERSVKKYLPLSYRSAFNFVAPRTPNAVTDDAYHCAVRDAAPVAGFKRTPEAISWGQVFATALRQPLLATALGMIYTTRISIDTADFASGGWLYVDLADDSDYKAQQLVEPRFVRRYAARIPVLEPGAPRSVFGAIQFPVTAVAPPGNYDALFNEAAEYDDGFAHVVHAFQPVSQSLLAEQSDGFHPTHELGIRLGWDDEQILVWYIRQLATDASVGGGGRIDAPLGMFGYRIDVRDDAPVPGPWTPLNQVASKAPLTVINPVSGENIALGDFNDRELPFQVYPSQLDGDTTKSYWLPMYFAAWAGKSMVLPDNDAAAIYQHDKTAAVAGLGVDGPPKNDLTKLYQATGLATPLRYGQPYQFRVRMADLSGGGPGPGAEPDDAVPSQIASCRFKRYVAPDVVRIADLPVNTDQILFADATLTMRRPLLGYPSVVFTGRYADPVTLLKNASLAATATDHVAFGIADPDVQVVQITVELQTLKMDNQASVSGREAYILYYTTTRSFPTDSPLFDDVLTIPLEYRDCHVLNFGDPGDLGDLGLTQAQIDLLPQLVLPRARTIRLTVRAVCEAKADYYGLEGPDPAFDTRYGRTVQFQLRADPLADETGLLGAEAAVRGIWLQPDPPAVPDGDDQTVLLGKVVAAKPPDMVQRLAQQLGVDSHGLTLSGKRGQRVQFGCSQRIRHTLSPDNASITFASKGDLGAHWLCCMVVDLQRDWTWDGLQDRALVINRSKRFRDDDIATETETLEVGDIEIRKTAPFQALQAPDRSHTTLIFIDAVEPKNELLQPPPNSTEPRWPDLIELAYTVTVAYKNPLGAPTDGDYTLPLELPITMPPAQIPRIVSVGLALSPYVAVDNYSSTAPRRRSLWVEFAEPVQDPQDSYFARVLAYAPDQLLSDNRPDLLAAPDEPALPIDDEAIRVISVNQPNDDAGLDAMQRMERSTGVDADATRFYLLPLPPGLQPDSPELFGFFTVEFRIGHDRYTTASPHHAVGDAVWTTAQGRYGRPLRVPGMQHPAPTLTCTVNRDEEKLYVTAPFAVATHSGQNVTANPPRTQLWALLYAQVKQADKLADRNVLLDDRVMVAGVQVQHDKTAVWSQRYTAAERTTLKIAALRNFGDDITVAGAAGLFKPADASTIDASATRYATAIWLDAEVTQLLARYGLPANTPLSVLCVELLPQVTNLFDHVRRLDSQDHSPVGAYADDQAIARGLAAQAIAGRSVDIEQDRGLSDQLGNYRILRTSPLNKVPFVC